MINSELRGMIKNKVPADQVDAQITAIGAKLDEAYAIVPEFPFSVVAIIAASIIGGIVAISSMKGGAPILGAGL